MQKLKDVQLVIASGSEKIQMCLQRIFAKHGAEIVLCGFLDLKFVEKLEHDIDADVILIDMDDSYEEDEDALDLLLEKIDLPILFHDNDFDELNEPDEGECFSLPAVEKLATKLAELVADNRCKFKTDKESESSDPVADDKQIGTAPKHNESKEYAPEVEQTVVLSGQESQTIGTLCVDDFEVEAYLPDEASLSGEASLPVEQGVENQPDVGPEVLSNVWVLGASIGGPEAVKRFLARIPKELPVAFVLAQHLGDGFVSLLANQLDRISRFSVKEAVSGETLRYGEVVVVPVDNRMSLDVSGRITFIEEDWKGHYKPSIDCVIDNVTSSFKKQSGVIIFSGMGADGVLASQKFAEKHNGIIWAQSTDSCVISSMPDSVRKANLVSYSGSPEALALKIAMHYMGKKSYIV